MKILFTFILLHFIFISFSQQKNEIGFYIAPLKQSAYTITNTAMVEDDFKPFFSLSIETGLYYSHKLNAKFALQHNVHFGILYHSTKTESVTFDNSTQIIISGEEAAYSLGYSPKLEYTPFQKLKQLQIIVGVGAKYFFDVSVENYGKMQLQNGAIYEETLFAKGSLGNIVPNEKNWQYNTEIGINYDVNLAKKRVLLKINPFYQHSFNTVYTGVYRYTKGTYTENGSFKNKVHQTGIRLLFGLTF